MCLAFALVAVAAFGAAGAPAPFLKPGNSAGLIGEWRQVAVEFEGVDQWPGEGPTLNRWLITRDTITIITRGKANRGSWHFRLHPGTPAGIDLKPGRGEAYPCVYKLEGNRLILCLQNCPARGRPKDLISRKGSGIGRFVYERMAPGEYTRQKE
jgi:uncharacterized protein (TIGR03067 family)